MSAGLRLHVTEQGDGPPVVLLHGFTGCSASLAGLAEALAPDHRVLAVDLVGHGRSPAPRDPAAYTMEACTAQLAAALDAADLGDAHWVGYSMGARAALAFAVALPARVRSLVAIGARAGFADPAERAGRIRADEALAARIEREGVPAFVDAWMALPLFASQRGRVGEAAWEQARRQRLGNAPHALAASLRGMGAGAQAPLHDALGRVRCPVLLIAGAEDARFAAAATDLAHRLPDAERWLVPDAGHAAHLERPAAVAQRIRHFLAAREAAARSTLDASRAQTARAAEERP